jgi:hypothetical protein
MELALILKGDATTERVRSSQSLIPLRHRRFRPTRLFLHPTWNRGRRSARSSGGYCRLVGELVARRVLAPSASLTALRDDLNPVRCSWSLLHPLILHASTLVLWPLAVCDLVIPVCRQNQKDSVRLPGLGQAWTSRTDDSAIPGLSNRLHRDGLLEGSNNTGQLALRHLFARLDYNMGRSDALSCLSF